MFMRVRLSVSAVLVIFLPATLSSSPAGQRSSPRPARATKQSQIPKLPASVLDAELMGARDGPFRLSDYSGKVLVVNLWATWCIPCRSQIDSLIKLHWQFRSKGVEILGLSTEDPEASFQIVSNMAFDFGVNYKIGWVPAEITTTLMNGRDAIPQTLVISRSGQIVKRIIGFNAESTPSSLKKAIEEALKENPNLPAQ